MFISWKILFFSYKCEFLHFLQIFSEAEVLVIPRNSFIKLVFSGNRKLLALETSVKNLAPPPDFF